MKLSKELKFEFKRKGAEVLVGAVAQRRCLPSIPEELSSVISTDGRNKPHQNKNTRFAWQKAACFPGPALPGLACPKKANAAGCS